MTYQYNKKDKVSVIKIDNKIVPIMISNKKSILIEYMRNIRRLKDDEYGIYYIGSILLKYPNIFNITIGSKKYDIEDYIMQSKYRSFILPSIDVSIIIESYKEAINTIERMIEDVNKTILALNVTNKSINNDLLKSLLESKNQLEKALNDKKQMKDIVSGYEYSNTILNDNIYDYIETRNSVMTAIEMTKEYKDICDLPY